MTATRMTVRRRPAPDGRSTVSLRGQLLFAAPSDPVANPAADGLQIRIEEADTGGAYFERTVLTDPLLASGWTANGSMTRFRWKTVGPAAGEKLTANLVDQRANGRMIAFKANAVGILPPTTGLLRLTIVLGGDLLGTNHAGDAGACAEHVFVCTSDATGLRLKCS